MFEGWDESPSLNFRPNRQLISIYINHRLREKWENSLATARFTFVVLLFFCYTRRVMSKPLEPQHMADEMMFLDWCADISVSRAGLEVNEKPLWTISKGQTSADIKSEACWWEKLDAKLCNGISRPAIIAPEKCVENVFEGEDAHYRSLIAMRRRTTRFIKLSRELFALLKGKQKEFHNWRRTPHRNDGQQSAIKNGTTSKTKLVKRFTRSRAEINLGT